MSGPRPRALVALVAGGALLALMAIMTGAGPVDDAFIFARFGENLSEYLAEESRTLVGKREAEAAFSELDALKVDIERLEARLRRLAHILDTSDNA